MAHFLSQHYIYMYLYFAKYGYIMRLVTSTFDLRSLLTSNLLHQLLGIINVETAVLDVVADM